MDNVGAEDKREKVHSLPKPQLRDAQADVEAEGSKHVSLCKDHPDANHCGRGSTSIIEPYVILLGEYVPFSYCDIDYVRASASRPVSRICFKFLFALVNVLVLCNNLLPYILSLQHF